MKKFVTWVFNHIEDDDDTIIEPDDPVIRILVPAIKCLFKKFLDKNEIAKLV